ncbi:MAG: sigma-70 family RNA polymerase sigma factor [Caulobacteraceae bacterium]|nr:sigma-70 family RNA polymerase sigma factor [Caulobacteraceae bacterium]
MVGVASGRIATVARGDDDKEARLIDKVARGDLRAFEDLYRIYHPRLSRFLLSVTRRPQLVDEVLSDTLLVVWRRSDGFEGRGKVSTWIFAIAYHKALNALRRLDEPPEDLDADRRESPDAGPEQQVGQNQVRQVLLKAIGELSADHRAVVDLAYFHEINYRDIAEIMDCPVDTVKTRMFHARRHLKTKLAGQLADWL